MATVSYINRSSQRDGPKTWRDTSAGREALEQERDAFEQEAARFTALGMQTQQRSEEAARAKEAAMQERLAAEVHQQETETLRRQMEVGRGACPQYFAVRHTPTRCIFAACIFLTQTSLPTHI
jgi:hypothetical protein